MKTPLIVMITGAALALGLVLVGRHIDIALCAVVLLGTGLIAWTVEQYYHRDHPR